ncbi:hypothetical protein N657DRAFT_678324 [Parathielavia appendiculata]|uniref:Uncharacterized protein n=1 Tax=Parathielavia appendiculata TaxID=2587402 RepID=A0AAN6U857_9PEZI|nr:hypothetical protein N657DRAFT_678324 [Parathielavia appendiculata]
MAAAAPEHAAHSAAVQQWPFPLWAWAEERVARWPGEEEENGEVVEVCKGKASWIDEDALHGPKVSGGNVEVTTCGGGGGGGGVVVGGFRKKKNKEKDRGSWPLRNRAPTSPRLHHTIMGSPYLKSGARGESSETLLCEAWETIQAVGMEHTQLRAFSEVLPQPPKPALVANRDNGIVRPPVTMGYVYGASRIPKPIVSPPASPVRSTPTMPSRHRGRQRSTESTLSGILRSTEERLREGSISGAVEGRRATSSPTRTSPGKDIGPTESAATGARSRTPSPRKIVSSQSFAPGHTRQDSQQSVSSETASLRREECPNPDISSGLTSPSRNYQRPEAEKQPMQTRAIRTSLSSELSTLYSEDEMPEEVKRTIMPLETSSCSPSRLPTSSCHP